MYTTGIRPVLVYRVNGNTKIEVIGKIVEALIEV